MANVVLKIPNLKMNKAYKTEIKPNNKQATMLNKHCGVARFVYNWGLTEKINQYKNTKTSDNAQILHKKLVQLKKSEYYFLNEVSKCAAQEALRDLDTAYKNFFRTKKGFPKYKSRKNPKQSFRLNGSIHIYEKHIQLPRIGKIRLKESNYLPLESKILSVTVSKYCNRWFVSVSVEEPDSVKPKLTEEIIGIDVGINDLAVYSDGTRIKNNKVLTNKLKRLRMLNKSLSRKQKGSKNRIKCRYKLAKLHYKINNIRKDYINKVTTALVRTKPKAVVMEKLNIKGMVKNHHLSRQIIDCSWFEIKKQLEYKLKRIGSELVQVDTFYPSSKTCSNCGNIKKELKLSERTYKCSECGLEIDRDLNASINLKKHYTVGSTEKACGEERFILPKSRRCSSVKQEINKEVSVTNFL